MPPNRPPTPRAVRRATWLLWPAALLITGALIWPSSYAAFSAKTDNPGTSFSVGTVNLGDDDSGTSLFNLTNLKPGSTGTQCIAVSSTGTLPSAVKLYTTGASTTKSLATYITLTITQGTGGSFSSCSGFTALSSGAAVYSGTLAALTGSATAYGSGLGTWAPTGNATDTRTFQFGYTVSASTPDTAQGGTATTGFTWEAQGS